MVIGVGQSAMKDRTLKSQVVELVLTRAQTDFDVAQTFTKSKLAEPHAQELIPTREGFDLIIALITAGAAAKLLKLPSQ